MTTTVRPSITTGRALSKAVCEALGLEPNRTYRIVLDLQANGAPRIRVSQFIDVEQERRLIERVFSISPEWKEEQ